MASTSAPGGAGAAGDRRALSRRADVIVLTQGGLSVGGVEGLLAIPGFAQTPPVRTSASSRSMISTSGFGPRIGDAIHDVALALHRSSTASRSAHNGRNRGRRAASPEGIAGGLMALTGQAVRRADAGIGGSLLRGHAGRDDDR